MKSKEDGKKCLDEFRDYRCQRPEGHRLKHWDDRNGFVMWTAAGAARILKEQNKKSQ
jgi:hypothetical protein